MSIKKKTVSLLNFFRTRLLLGQPFSIGSVDLLPAFSSKKIK